MSELQDGFDADGTLHIAALHGHVRPEAIDVRIVNQDEPVRPERPQLASWQGMNLAGTEAAFILIPQDKRRRKATIVVQAAASTTYLLIGSMAQVQNGQGFFLSGCSSLVYEAQAAIWARPSGALTVSVLDTRYVV